MNPNNLKPKVLIVDDEEIIRKLCRRLLLKWNLELFFADTIKLALSVIRATPLELLITDLGLPDGNGVDAVQCFRNLFPEKKVIVITGLPKALTHLETLGGAKPLCLIKPFENNVFLNLVQEALKI